MAAIQDYNAPLCIEKHKQIDQKFAEQGTQIKTISDMTIELHESNALFKQALDIMMAERAHKPTPFWQTKLGERVIMVGIVLVALVVLIAIGLNATDALGVIKGVTTP